jgi:signal transduction histidine kinase
MPYDADANKVEITIPDVIDENATVVIEDNGNGMLCNEIQKKYLHIGRNRRMEGKKHRLVGLVIGSKRDR